VQRAQQLRITAEPQSQSVQDGATAVFSLSVAGTAPFSVSWYNNGTLAAQSSVSASPGTAQFSVAAALGANGATVQAVVSTASEMP